MDKYTKKLVKKSIKLQEVEVRKFILEFDPLGIGEGCPEDEYDDLVQHIVSILNQSHNNTDNLLGVLIDIILEYADLSMKYTSEASRTAEKILQWWYNLQSNKEAVNESN